jgi:hypothetical protein
MPVPEAVEVDVFDADLESMRADFRRRHYGISRPWILAIGVIETLFGILRVSFPPAGHTLGDFWMLGIGLGFVALAWIPDPGIPSALRPTGVRFSDIGLDIDVAFAPPANRHYAWDTIRRIDDVGDAFVIVPKIGKRLVLPKRAFADGGREAKAFFAAHVKT